MFDNNIILRLKDSQIFTENPKPAHAILLCTDRTGLSCGTPVLLDSNYMTEHNAVRSFCLFPPRYGVSLENDIECSTKSLELVGLEPITSIHKVLNVQKFELKKLIRLFDYVHSVGAISFTIENEKSRLALPDIMPIFTKYYKYSSVFNAYHNGKFLDGKDDNVVAVLSFFNLPYCVPLFNIKKVHGLGVSYCQAIRKESERRSHLVRTFRFDFVLSNYEDNLFVIDGVDINPQNAINEKWVNDLSIWAEERLSVRDYSAMLAERNGIKWERAGKSLKANPSGEIIFDEANKWYNNTATSTTFYYGSSSTSNKSND